eukprot:2354476-Amphidinium_carterae.2
MAVVRSDMGHHRWHSDPSQCSEQGGVYRFACVLIPIWVQHVALCNRLGPQGPLSLCAREK